LAHFNGDLTRANLSPRKRDKILTRYPAPETTPTPETTDALGSGAAAVPPPEEVMTARCPGCSYTYEVDTGDEREGFPAGTAWSDIPETWCCPDCGVRDKTDFVPLTKEDAR
ncbi:MAG TPA: rubredoxin, partial [Trueperaceae bacterium]|nr:rubredoxin [Trueperaceae bacterium]